MAKRRYAQDTRVPVERTQGEIRKMIERVDGDQFIFGTGDGRVMVGFRVAGPRHVRITLPLPDDREQTERMVWRQILLLITARVTEIQSEIATFEEAFLPYLLLPDNTTVRDHALPALARAYETGEVPALLPGEGS